LTKEMIEKVKKTANLNFNLLLNKSFRKNKIGEICSIVEKILVTVSSQLSVLPTLVSEENIFMKVCNDLLKKIDDLKYVNICGLIVKNIIFGILKRDEPSEIDSSVMLDKDLEELRKSLETPYLPQIKDNLKYTLVIDLDNTLVSFFNTPSGGTFLIRPKAVEFLREVSKTYEVVVFTMATKEYADAIIDLIDPDSSLITHRLYRQHTSGGGFLREMPFKDLDLLGRDLSKTISIDDIESNYRKHVNNALVSLMWRDDIFDEQFSDFLYILNYIQNNEIEDIPSFVDKVNVEKMKVINGEQSANLYRKIILTRAL